MSKHTQGPWEVRVPFSTAARHPAYIVAGERILAAVRVPGVAYEDLRTAHANAAVLAAAPTMHDLLVRLEDAVEALDGTSVENEKLVDDYRAWRAQSTPQPPAPPADHS